MRITRVSGALKSLQVFFNKISDNEYIDNLIELSV